MKKSYAKPMLSEIGDVSKLTQLGGGTNITDVEPGTVVEIDDPTTFTGSY